MINLKCLRLQLEKVQILLARGVLKCGCFVNAILVNMPFWTRTRPVLGRCCQHQPSTGMVLAYIGMFLGLLKSQIWNYFKFP